MNGETVAKTVDCTSLGLTKGSYTTTIPTDELPKTTSLTWKVVVTGNSVASPTIQSDLTLKYCLPRGIGVDCSTESPYFGRIYTTDATGGAAYHASEGKGLYVFDAALNPITNSTGGKKFTGAITFGDDDISRVVVSDDGRVFLSRFSPTTVSPVVEVNPGDLNANFKDVFTSIKGKTIGIDVKGAGENLKLVMLSTTNRTITEYDLGTATQWTSSTPSREYTKKDLTTGQVLSLVTDNAYISYDLNDGVWLTQHRATATTKEPTIAHVIPSGMDYNNFNAGLSHNNTSNGGIAISPDGKLLAVVGAGTKKLTIYSVSRDNGDIALTSKYTISTSGDNHTALEWDYAGNLYVANRSAETITFYAMPYSGTVSTPCASKYAFELQESIGTIYTVTATASPAEAGTVAGAGEYAQDTEVTLTAIANTGYRFENWTVGSNTETANPLTFTITENITATANFVALTPYTINATANDANMGTVTGGGTYYEGETVTLTATPKTGYRFVNWSNSSTDAKLTFTASENLDLTANFEICTYTLTSFSNDETKGTVSGAGTYNYGATATLTATPTDGYKLLYWSDRTTENPRTITMTKNETISAYFVKEYAVEPTFTIEKVWENTNVPASTNNGYQAVGWDGKIYMKDRLNATINFYTETGTELYVNTDAFTSEDALKGDQPIAIDDAGNLIIRSGSGLFYNAPTQLTIYQKDQKTGKVIDFTLPATGRCDFISASGDIYSQEGGYVYFYCQNQTTVSRLFIKNGGTSVDDISADMVENATLTAGSSQSHVFTNIFGDLMTHTRASVKVLQEVNVVTGAVTTMSLPNFKQSTLGGCSFELGGKELIAYNIAGTDYNSEWKLYNMTDKQFLSGETLYAKDKVSKNSAANWLNVQVVDENTAYIYQFCPTVAVAVWKVTMHEVVLRDTENNEELLTDLNGSTTNVSVYRSLTGGMYNTLCLPFNVNDLTGTPLENATIWQYNGATVKGDGTSKEIFLDFAEVTSITAGEPYLVEPAEDIATPMEFKNVTISVTNGSEIAPHTAVTMHGILHPTELQANNKSILFLVENNNLAWANETANMNGMRAYFKVNEPSLLSARTRAYIRKEPTVATDMENITTSETEIKKVIYNGNIYIIRGDEVYTIQGTKVK